MPAIVLKDITPDCSLEQKITCSSESLFFIDDKVKGRSVPPGDHTIKIVRHHDLFFDWFMDDGLVEEFLVYPLISDHESCMEIKYDGQIVTEGLEIDPIAIFPLVFEGKTELNIKCLKPSQLSLYFSDSKEDYNKGTYESVTLLFEQDYCKVFKDFHIDSVYQKDKRLNLSLFKTAQGESTRLLFIPPNMVVSNSVTPLKEYKPEVNMVKKYLIVGETYCPTGKGRYEVN